MSVRVGKEFIRALVCGLIAMLVCFSGCESLKKVKADTQVETEVETYRQLSALEQQRKVLEEKVKQQKDEIRALAEEHGAGHLDSRLQMQVQRVAALMEEMVEIESDRTKLEVEVDVFKALPSKTPEQMQRLEKAEIELQMVRTYESRMRDILTKEDAQAVELGRRKLALEGLKEQLLATEKELEKVTKAIRELQ